MTTPRISRVAGLAAIALMVGAARSQAQPPRVHDLKVTPEHIHWGHYDARLKPVLRVASGERVNVETMMAGGLRRLRMLGVPDAEIPASLRAVERAVTDRGPGPHPMTGPIHVDGAEAGDTLEVRLLSIGFLHDFGINAFAPGGGTIPDDFPYSGLKLLRWRPGATAVEFAPGIVLPLAPFFGSIGVAPPPLSGRLSSRPPGWHGGNLDNKDLVAGTTLFLPVHVPGALLSMGDGHAMQGHGEVTGTALETSLTGQIEVRLHKGQRLKWPRAETPTHYIAMGLDEDLDQATSHAVREMVEFLVAEKKLSPDDAYMLCSLSADLHVTQAVDGVKGVHASLPKSVFR
jgi:acetamidase/formamidase